METSDVLALVGTIAVIGMPILSGLFMNSMKQMGQTIEKQGEHLGKAIDLQGEELHKVQVAFAGIVAQLQISEGVRANVHSLREIVHQMQLKMAVAGMWDKPPEKKP